MTAAAIRASNQDSVKVQAAYSADDESILEVVVFKEDSTMVMTKRLLAAGTVGITTSHVTSIVVVRKE